MGDYTLNVPDGANSFSHNGVEYGGGAVYETDNPCDALAFYNSARTTNPKIPRSDRTPNFWQNMEEACAASGGGTTAAPPPEGETPPTNDGPPPGGEDSGDEQSAPRVDPPVGGTETGPEGVSPGIGEEPRRPPEGEADPENSGEAPHQQTVGGDPVDLFAGRFTLEETDLSLVTAVLPLDFTRYYQSGQSYFGPFGWGWDHNHNQYVRELSIGAVAHWTGRLREEIHAPDGGGFKPPPGVFHVFERLPGPSTRYLLKASEGLETLFEQPAGWGDAERIPIAMVTDRFGNRLFYSYDGQSRLSKVEDDDGRFLAFTYGACGLLETVFDHSGRTVRYGHHPDIEHLVCVQFPATPERPEGWERHFHYPPLHFPPPLRHAIVRVEDGDGQVYLQNAYEDDPASFAFGRVREQLYGDFHYQVRYTELQYVPASPLFLNIPALRVEVMTPDFSLYTHTFNYRGDLLDYRFRLNSDGSYRVVAYAFGYDSEGNRTQTVFPDGGEELRTFADSDPDPRMRGRLLKRELRARPGFPSPSRIVLQAEYEPQYQLLKKLRDERGAETLYIYDLDTAPGPGAAGRLERVELPSATLPDGTLQAAVIGVTLDSRGRLTALVSANGVAQSYEYGATGNDIALPVRTIRDAGGLAVSAAVAYDLHGNIAAATDGLGAATDLHYDARDRLREIAMPEIDGMRGAVRLDYDSQGVLVALRRPRGAYDDAALAGSAILDRIERNVLGHVRSIVYGANTARPIDQTQSTDHRGLVICARDPEGMRTRQCFDERSLALRRAETGSDGSARAKRWVYDRAGRLMKFLDGQEAPAETGYDYDAFGRLLRVVLPDGAEQRYVYGPGDVVIDESLTGNDGTGTTRLLARKSYDYDERGRMIRETRFAFESDPATAQALTTTYTFDADDRLVETEDHRGARTRMAYDGLNRLVSVTDPAGNRVEYGYDAEGRRTLVRTRDQEAGAIRQRAAHYAFDTRGRMTSAIAPGGEVTTYRYDDRNTLIRIEAPLGRVDLLTYGQLGELLSREIDPGGVGVLHRWTYDRRLLPTSYTDPEGERTDFLHDGLGRMIEVRLPNGFSSTRSYNADGRLSAERLAGGTLLTFGYDSAGRLASLKSAGSPTAAAVADHGFAYDARGHITRATAGSRVTVRRHDSLGRLLEEAIDGLSHRNSFDDLAGTIDRHWTDGRHERIETDIMGRPIRLRRLAAGTLAGDVSDLAQFGYAGAGAVESSEVFASVRATTRFDSGKRAISHGIEVGGNAIESQQYRFDALGRTRVAASAQQGIFRYHEHDLPGRLTEAAEDFAPPALGGAGTTAEQANDIAAVRSAAAGAPRRVAFGYDRADARTSRQETGGPPLPYSYLPGKRLAAAGTEAMTFTPDAQRTSDGRNSYEHDALGRVVRILSADGTSERARFEYDALGRLAVEHVAGLPARRRAYFGQAEVEEHESGTLVRQYSASPVSPVPLAIHQGGQSFIPLHDQRLNRVALLDSAGQTLERYVYRPFGRPEVLAPDGTPRAASLFGLPPVFGGMPYLAEAGLYRARRRLMDPLHGVFLSGDPFGPLDSANLYAYARQNPGDFIDPEGDFAFLAGLLIAAAVGAAVGGGVNAARQAIAISEGSQDGWDWGQFGLSVGFGAIAGPALVVAPELAIPLAAYGVVNGGVEIARGNYYSGAFDVVTAVVPFGFKGVRTSAFGRGSVIGEVRGLGPRTPMSVRVGRFRLVGENARHILPRLRGRRIGLGFAQAQNSPEGHVAVVLENSEGGLWFVEKNAAQATDPATGAPGLVASFREAPEPLTIYSRRTGQVFEYEQMSIGEDSVRAASEHARTRLQDHGVEPFDFKTANCSHFGCDVLGAAGFRGLGNGRGSGLWSDFTNLTLARTMMRAATVGPPQLGEDAAAEDDPQLPPKK